MSRDTPPEADVQICFHECEIFGATTTSGKEVLAFRIHGHLISQPEGKLKIYEIIMDEPETFEALAKIMQGFEALTGRSSGMGLTPPASIPINYGSMN